MELLGLSVACGFADDGDADRCSWIFVCLAVVCFVGRSVGLHQNLQHMVSGLALTETIFWAQIGFRVGWFLKI